MEYKDWIQAKPVQKIEYLKGIIEGSDGRNGLKGQVLDLDLAIAKIDRSIGKLKQRIQVATLVGFLSLLTTLGVKHWDLIVGLLKLR